MNRTNFAQIVTSAWYLFEGLTEKDLVEDYDYKRDNVKTGAKLCKALENK